MTLYYGFRVGVKGISVIRKNSRLRYCICCESFTRRNDESMSPVSLKPGPLKGELKFVPERGAKTPLGTNNIHDAFKVNRKFRRSSSDIQI